MLVIDKTAIRGKRGPFVYIAVCELTQIAAIAVGDPDVKVPSLQHIERDVPPVARDGAALRQLPGRTDCRDGRTVYVRNGHCVQTGRGRAEYDAVIGRFDCV